MTKQQTISVKNFDVYYGAFQVLDDISLQVYPNKITSIIGPSGCGKSTFLRALNRMNDLIPEYHFDGSIELDGKDLHAIELVTLRKRFGMVFQRPNPFPMSIYNNIAYGPRAHGIRSKGQLDVIVEEALVQAALWDEVKDVLSRSALSLSGGQQQRLCVARALAVKPEVLLMDEPAAALDPVATLKIEDLMQALKSTLTILIVTHNMQQASRCADFTAFFNMNDQRAGYLVEYGETEQIFTNPKEKLTESYISGRFG